MAIEPAPLPPKEALEFFRKKGKALGFSWKDIWEEEHAVGFTVAKAMRHDLLGDIRQAVDDALAKGETIQQFRKNLRPLLEKKGWWGRKKLTDPKTGKVVSAQLGSPRRLRIIYDTNMRMATAAGRWQRIERLRKKRPYLRYVAVMDSRTRDQHRQWHGTILPVGDKFWETHYPPNGWNCRCMVAQLGNEDLERYGWTVSRRPSLKLRDWKNNRSGEVVKVAEGISPGFGYNVGKARLRALVPPPLGGLPTSFPAGTDLPPLPPPLKSKARLLPDGLAEEEYAKRFLQEFGVKAGRIGQWRDPAGEVLTISEELFKDTSGAWKITKYNRHRHLLYLAEAIKTPHEIWWIWEKGVTDGKWRLRRRYFARFLVSKGQSAVAVFEHGEDGWRGVTGFSPAQGSPERQERYLNKFRGGLLAWRKK